MSEEVAATQDNTSAEVSSETQAQAPSAGETVLKPADAITADAAEAQPTETQAKEEASSDAEEQDLGLLSTKAKDEAQVPESYELTLPDGLDASPEDVAALQQLAKENGFTQEQAQAGATMTVQAIQQLQAQAKAESDSWKAEQQKQWSEQSDAADKQLLAEKALKHAGVYDYMVEQGYVHDATLLKAWSEFGALISEAKVIVGSEAGPGGSMPANPYSNSPEFNN
jgi:hypothetical protein